MKKAISVLLSLAMLLCLLPGSVLAAEKSVTDPASGYAEYDRARVIEQDSDYIDSLTYDQLASLLLDFADRKIAAAAAELDAFEVEVLGQTVSVELDVSSVDGLLGYIDYASVLGGDFAALDYSALSGVSRAGGDINLIYSFIDFLAANRASFGKLFSWQPGDVFDFGAVGAYIEGLDSSSAIKKLYQSYLVGGDIQTALVDMICAQSGYQAVLDDAGERTQSVDEIAAGALTEAAVSALSGAGLLSEQAAATVRAEYDLKTDDIYTLIKNLVSLLQQDNEEKERIYFTFYLDNYIRSLLKATFGYSMKLTGQADFSGISDEFCAVYTDRVMLYQLSGGTVNYKASDGSYYKITLGSDGSVLSCESFVWENGMGLSFEPATVGIYTGAAGQADRVIGGYDCELVKTYSTYSDDYSLTVYSPYKQQLDSMSTGLTVTDEAVPQEFSALMTEQNAVPMRDLMAVYASSGGETLSEQVITFEAVESYAQQLATEAAQSAAEGMGATVESVDVALSYQGYATDDEFITEVTAAVSASVSVEVMGIPVSTEIDISSAIKNPVATVVVDNLSGGGINEAAELFNFINSDFDVNTDILDFAGRYDSFNGVIGQVNTVLCSLLEMLLSSQGYESLELVDGKNDNLTANLQKLCNKVDSLLALTKAFMDEQGFADFIASSGVNDLFASSHGFNASMVYNLDFSSVESLYVCGIEMVLDFIDDETPGVINDLHEAVEGLDTLDQVAAAFVDYALTRLASVMNEKLSAYSFSYTHQSIDPFEVTDGKQAIMPMITDFLLYLCTFGVDNFANTVINEKIDEANAQYGSDISHVSLSFGVSEQGGWEQTLLATVDRIYELLDGIVANLGDYESTDVFDRISYLLNKTLPVGSLFSNCAGGGFAVDIGLILNDYIFENALSGSMDSVLSLFETEQKSEDVMQDVPVCYGLALAFEKLVESVLPGAIDMSLYPQSETVLQQLTCSEGAAVNGAGVISALRLRKESLVPALLDLMRQAGLCPYFACCDHSQRIEIAAVAATCVSEGKTAGWRCAECSAVFGCTATPIDKANHAAALTDTPAVTATCVSTGYTAGSYCSACGQYVSGHEQTPINPSNHGGTFVQPAQSAGCTHSGVEAAVYCSDCGALISGGGEIPATGHTDADSNGVCDSCGESLAEPEQELSFFERIRAFFMRIIEWLRNLFS